MPLMAFLVDNRHIAVYGTVYALAQVSISLGFAIGMYYVRSKNLLFSCYFSC